MFEQYRPIKLLLTHSLPPCKNEVYILKVYVLIGHLIQTRLSYALGLLNLSYIIYTRSYLRKSLFVFI